MPKAVRHINEMRALDAIFTYGSMSRADLARRLDITRATASNVVSNLINSGFLIENADVETDVKRVKTGRPGKYISICPTHAVFLGADIAVGHITISAVNLNADIIGSITIPFNPSTINVEDICLILSDNVKQLVQELDITSTVNGLNIVIPGLVDLKGCAIRAPALGWKKVKLAKMIQAQLEDIEVNGLENDANAFAFADMRKGNHPKVQDAVYLFIAFGVGGCVISGGKINRGVHGYAGEIGHIVIGEKGYFSEGTVEGSLETFITKEAVLNYYHSIGGQSETFEDFLIELKNNNKIALNTAENWAYYLGRGLSIITSILNPEKIIIGGQVSELLNFVYEKVQNSIQHHLLDSSNMPQLERSSLGSEAPAIGAALMLHKDFLSYDEELLFGGKK
jgi:predicted NBD/HSP70 family sugar kinase